MDVALRKSDANPSILKKCVNAVTEFTPHFATVHGWTEAHPELQAEHERIVPEILQQHIRGGILDDVGMLGSRLTDEFGDFRRTGSVSDVDRHRIARQVVAQCPIDDFLFQELAVGHEHLNAVAARDQ